MLDKLTKTASYILEMILLFFSTCFVYVLKGVNGFIKACLNITEFVIMYIMLISIGVFIDTLPNPWQSLVLNSLIYGMFFMAISLFILALWKPKRFEKILERVSS